MTKEDIRAIRNLKANIFYYAERKRKASGKTEKAYWQRKIGWTRRVLRVVRKEV